MNKHNLLLEIRTTATIIFAFTLILCAVYPLVVWGVAQLFFPVPANGSWIQEEHRVVGSRLIGQSFGSASFFFSRPSCAGSGYDAQVSGGSNLGPLSPTLYDQVARRVARYRQENGLSAAVLVPVDAVTASASGLDPHISLANARLQVNRVAKARGCRPEKVQEAIQRCLEYPQLGIFGEIRVNVLLLNIQLDKIKGQGATNERRKGQ